MDVDYNQASYQNFKPVSDFFKLFIHFFLLAGFLVLDFLSLLDFLEGAGLLLTFTGFTAGFLEGILVGTAFLAGFVLDFTG